MNYIRHLKKDQQILKIIEKYGTLPILRKENNLYLALIKSIISQQLSTRVATVIRNRFFELFQSEQPTIDQILSAEYDLLRGIGLSHSKTNYIQNVCTFFIDNHITDSQLHNMENDAFISFITQIKGIGKWSAKMLLIFAMGRPDVFPIADLGIQRAMQNIYGIPSDNKKEMLHQYEKIAENWMPYRSYASLYLWKSLDNN